jgi:hypothetical protein
MLIRSEKDMNTENRCLLCGEPTDPFEKQRHQRCLTDENIMSDIQSIVADMGSQSDLPSHQEEVLAP